MPDNSFSEIVRELETSSFPNADDLGTRAPRCWRAAWNCCEALYRFSTCADECPGPEEDHTVRFLVGRIVNEGLAALDCLERGHYDGALIVCRVMFEQHNILTLLLNDAEYMQVFKRSEPAELLSLSKPIDVRKRLRAIGAEDALVREINRSQEQLNQRVMHPALEQLGASHTPGHVVIGPTWQIAGFILGINEVALALGSTLARLIMTNNWPRGTSAPVSSALEGLSDGLGGLRADHLPATLRQALPEDKWLE